MNGKLKEGFLIIVITEFLLVSFSYLFSSSINNDNSLIKFISLDKILNLSLKTRNIEADSLIKGYISNSFNNIETLKRSTLSALSPKKQNVYLINPEINGSSALDNFFKTLNAEKDSCVVRIAHYGDSQLEGDRMTWIIRKKFHEKFGGSGIGYVPFKDLPSITYSRNCSHNWARYTVFNHKNIDKNYGISGAVFKFYSYAVNQRDDDTSKKIQFAQDTNLIQKKGYYKNATLNIDLNKGLIYHDISILYGRSSEKCLMNFYNNLSGEKIFSDTLQSSSTVNLSKHRINLPAFDLKIEFIGENSPDFYGVYLDDDEGVQVDNYAIRGHSGDGLMMISDEVLSQTIKKLNTKLIIFQYGANVVPYVKSKKACIWLEDIYFKLFMKFKRAAPDISILVIGAGDMAYETEGEYKSYDYIPKINEAQRNAALKAGCAFLNLFEMMGGSNSIMVWSEKKLAVPNGHFSNKGQEIIANELVNAIMIEYNIFVHKTNKRKTDVFKKN